jgi:hypothetical protein
MTKCVWGITDEHGKPVYDKAGNFVKCGKPASAKHSPIRICDEHYPEGTRLIRRELEARTK